MALMTCPECHKEVSDQAATCPGCGFPIHHPSAPAQPLEESAPPVIVTVRKSRGIYILLALLFGWFGAHNFYAGYYWYGAIQLIVMVTLFWTVFVPILPALLAFAEAIMTTEDGNGVKFA